MIHRRSDDATAMEPTNAALDVCDGEGVVGPGVVWGGRLGLSVVQERIEHPDVNRGILAS